MSDENAKRELWVSEAQKEVWEWKERLSEDLNNVADGKWMEYIIEKTKDIRAELEAMRKAKNEKQDA